MEDCSVFLDKEIQPTADDLKIKLGKMYNLWLKIQDYTLEQYPEGQSEWNYPSKKFGWSFRIKDKKRAIIYLLPRDNFFKVAFVFGEKATQQISKSTISKSIQTELELAKPYAEGRGIRIIVTDESLLLDIKQLIAIKLQF